MKKALIAGAASLAIAAMPVVGVFAADVTTQTDTLSVTIDATCTFKADSITHSNGTSNVGTWAGDVLSGTMTNGSNTDDYGSTSFTVVCNNVDGWQVSADIEDLDGAASGQSIAPNAAHSATISGYSLTVSQAADNGLTIPSGKQAADGQVASMATATDNTGKTFTVTYGMGISETQAADTYTGDILYTLATL